MKFNQSAVLSEVLNVLKTAAEEDHFDGFKVDPDSIEQVSPAPTDTSGTKGTTFRRYFYDSLRLYFKCISNLARDIALGLTNHPRYPRESSSRKI